MPTQPPPKIDKINARKACLRKFNPPVPPAGYPSAPRTPFTQNEPKKTTPAASGPPMFNPGLPAGDPSPPRKYTKRTQLQHTQRPATPKHAKQTQFAPTTTRPTTKICETNPIYRTAGIPLAFPHSKNAKRTQFAPTITQPPKNTKRTQFPARRTKY